MDKKVKTALTVGAVLGAAFLTYKYFCSGSAEEPKTEEPEAEKATSASTEVGPASTEAATEANTPTEAGTPPATEAGTSPATEVPAEDAAATASESAKPVEKAAATTEKTRDEPTNAHPAPTPFGTARILNGLREDGMLEIQLAWDGFTSRAYVSPDSVGVHTPYGPAFIVPDQKREDGMVEVKLQWDGFKSTAVLNPDTLVYHTPYGPARVLSKAAREDGMVEVLLQWDSFKARAFVDPACVSPKINFPQSA